MVEDILPLRDDNHLLSICFTPLHSALKTGMSFFIILAQAQESRIYLIIYWPQITHSSGTRFSASNFTPTLTT